MSHKSLCKTLGILPLMIYASAVLADAPDPSQVYIRGIVHAGTGCPVGTVAGNVSPDAQAFTLIFDEFLAEAGPGISLSRSRAFCQLNLDLHIPNGWSYTVFKVDYRGFAALDPGTIGTQTASYYFQGDSHTVTLRSNIRGGYNRDYLITDRLGISAVVWSPCGIERALNIKAQVAVQAGFNQRALMTVDSIDGDFKQIYGVMWRHCR